MADIVMPLRYYCVGSTYERVTVGRKTDERGDRLCVEYE